MDKTPKLSGYAWLPFAITAILMFPPFMPTTYLLPLFVPRLVGAAALAYLAYRLFRRGTGTLPPMALAVAAAVALLAGGYLAAAGEDLMAPDNGHIQALVETSLNSQGAETAASYADVKVSGAECGNQYGDGTWGCFFTVSYTSPTGREYAEDGNLMLVSKETGERVTEDGVNDNLGCELNFQWSNRVRASPHYIADLEPIGLGGCSYDKQAKSYSRQVQMTRGQRVDNGLAFTVFEANPAATVLVVPTADAAKRLVKSSLKGNITRLDCEDATAKPSATSVTCFVAGTMTTWLDTSMASAGQSLSETTAFDNQMTLVPEGLQWVVRN